jgi:hypothetical protein
VRRKSKRHKEMSRRMAENRRLFLSQKPRQRGPSLSQCFSAHTLGVCGSSQAECAAGVNKNAG